MGEPGAGTGLGGESMGRMGGGSRVILCADSEYRHGGRRGMTVGLGGEYPRCVTTALTCAGVRELSQ